MSEPSIFKRHWKTWLNVITVAALIIVTYFLRGQIVQTFKNLGHVHAWALILILPIEFLNYYSQAKVYQSLFAVLGNKISYKKLFKTSLELNFVNGVFPSGGVTGVSYFGLRMRSSNVTGGRATVVQLMKLVMVFVSFEILLIIGLVLLALAGRVSDITILIAGSLTTLVVGLTGLFMYIIGSERRINNFLTFVTHAINRIIHVIRPKTPETINIARARELFTDLHYNYVEFRDKYKQLRAPLAWAFVANLTEVMAVYVVYVAFGHFVNFGAIIVAYAVANFAGFVSVLPGGIGIYEALMTAVLATAGIPASLSIPVVIMYRVVNTVIQLPPGYYFYHRALNSRSKELNHGRT